jgi:asparagine N-glycosylation enzyme membrane subunit Stt3
LQFGLRAIFLATTLVAVLFSGLSWLGLSAQARFIILLVLGVSVAAAAGLLIVIAGAMPEEPQEPENEPQVHSAEESDRT